LCKKLRVLSAKVVESTWGSFLCWVGRASRRPAAWPSGVPGKGFALAFRNVTNVIHERPNPTRRCRDSPFELHGYHDAGRQPSLHQRTRPPLWTQAQGITAYPLKKRGWVTRHPHGCRRKRSRSSASPAMITNRRVRRTISVSAIKVSRPQSRRTMGKITASLCLSPEQDNARCQAGGLILKLITSLLL
jgi:hypothetical protein